MVVLSALVWQVAATTPCTYASPWNRNSNEVFVNSQLDYFSTNLNCTVSACDRFERIGAGVYTEFGVTDRIMIGGKAIYSTSWMTSANAVDFATGFSEAALFGQYQAFRSGPHAGAFKIAVARPASFQSGARPSLQSEGYDVEISTLYGRTLFEAPIKSFASLDVGYRKRFSAAADQILLRGSVGIEPSDRILFLLDTYATVSVRNEQFSGADYDLLKLQPSLVLRFRKSWRVQVGVTEEITGRDIALGRTVFFSLWSTF